MPTTESTIPAGGEYAAQLLLTGWGMPRIRIALREDRWGPQLPDAGAVESALAWARRHYRERSQHRESEPPSIRADNTPHQVAIGGPYFARVDPPGPPGFPRRAYVTNVTGGLVATLVQGIPGKEQPADGAARLLASSWLMREALERVLAWFTAVNTAEPDEIVADIITALLEAGLPREPLEAVRSAAIVGAATLGGRTPVARCPITEESRRRLREHALLTFGPDGPAGEPSGLTSPAAGQPAEPGRGQSPPPGPPGST